MLSKESEGIIFAVVILAILCLLICVLFLFFLKKKNALLNKQAETKKQFEKELVYAQIEIQNQTMLHIGREIHDNVGQKLTLASLYTQQLAFENKAPHINESIENISKIINESLTELRELSKSLTDDSIEENTLFDLITNECVKVKKTKKCKISFECENKNIDLEYQQKSILLRICQEFIQNSLKYSQCKHILIVMSNDNNHLQLELNDDGIGFDTSIKSKGIGIENMKKRTALLKGTFEFLSQISIGTKLKIQIPLN
jgi:signal transduction histidine kinase